MKKPQRARFAAYFLGFVVALTVHAGEPLQGGKAPPKAKPATQDVLDFDADVIEGQRKAPELFLQTEVQKPALDSVLFQRKDFNDFHSLDAARRPRLAEPPKGGAK